MRTVLSRSTFAFRQVRSSGFSRLQPPEGGTTNGLWLCLGLFVGLAGCGTGQLEKTAEEKLTTGKATPVVRVVSARLHAWPKSIRVQGSLVGDEQAVVGAKVAGRVAEVKVDLGTVVRQGQVLCSLDPEEFRSSRAAGSGPVGASPLRPGTQA